MSMASLQCTHECNCFISVVNVYTSLHCFSVYNDDDYDGWCNVGTCGLGFEN
jgi:hypothetical protein